MWAYLLARFGAVKLAIAGAILLVILAFAGIAGWNKIKASWYESVAESAKAQLKAEKANVKTLQKDLEVTDKAVAVTADTVKKMDKTAIKQRVATAKSKEIVRERIQSQPVVTTAVDPVVLNAVREARLRAEAASRAVSGAQGAGRDTASANGDGLSSVG